MVVGENICVVGVIVGVSTVGVGGDVVEVVLGVLPIPPKIDWIVLLDTCASARSNLNNNTTHANRHAAKA
jgi:hypothetical protein